jgi:hypothetical protein
LWRYRRANEFPPAKNRRIDGQLYYHGFKITHSSACHGDDAWIVTREQVIKEGWFGPLVTADASSRLGDVALVAKTDVAFIEPTDTGPYDLIGRHGSATAAELWVPLLVGRG